MVLQIEAAGSAADAVNDDLPDGAARVVLPVQFHDLRSQARRLRVTDGLRILGDTDYRLEPGCIPAGDVEQRFRAAKTGRPIIVDDAYNIAPAAAKGVLA